MILFSSAEMLPHEDNTKKLIKFDKNIQELPTAAFSGQLLMEISLPPTLKVIGPEAFLNCSLLENVRIPMTCKEIRQRAFLGCCSLQGLVLPTSMTVVREECFSRCSKLKTMLVPWSVVVIEHGAFSYCTALLSVELPKGLRKIESRAFAHCEHLVNFDIPSSVNRIEDNVFSECDRRLELRFGVNLEAMERRFGDDVPLHKFCYYQAHYTLAAKLKKFEKAIRMDGEVAVNRRKSKRSGGIFSLCFHRKQPDLPLFDCDMDAGDLIHFGSGYSVDCFDMTPLHVLVLSSRPCLTVCETLLAHFPSNVTSQDHFDHTPIDYACMVNAPIPIMEALLSTQRQELNSFHDEEMQRCKGYMHLTNQYDSMDLLLYFASKYYSARIDALGLNQWRNHVIQEIETLATLSHAMLREDQLERVSVALCQYERKETLSLLELALWKTRIQSEYHTRISGPSWRRTCQIQSGAEIAIPLIKSYLKQ